ncbi:AAA family ATPase [Bacillus sp. ISL-37]|uniref:ATP-dependent nuclease n=1 Tax=Bacillus sp. ISL-37 TaxID=2819123 RepID=UPI001BE87740|nr:AAA family ATPase [Bacillus sp. ISL-37]MBT2683367.1 AAA family ATPase [Bacillus sp. ISL-37]
MFISEIKEIKNYRNLTGTQFFFDKNMNFIVGENNIGKTNVMELLNSLLNKGRFDEKDFYDLKEPIQVTFTIEYTEEALGFFENNFDIEDEFRITIKAVQETADDRIEYIHHSTPGTRINFRTVKSLNFVYYSSLRSPNKEINFINNIGTGKVLNYLMNNSLKNKEISEVDLINIHDIEHIVEDFNMQIGRLNGLSGEKIQAFVNSDNDNIINRLLEIGDDSGRSLDRLGDGLRYSFNIFLNILELLINLKTTKKAEDFEGLLITYENGKRYLPLILALDEPEIHQHPYRQRALIKSLKNILSNKNKEFANLIWELFGINGFIGQVFIITHSPNILPDDYKQITRLFQTDNVTRVISGQKINFEEKVHKHLVRSFIYIKEAMFSKHVILVEGDTEYGAVPVFINRMNYDIDEKGIGVIKLDGADSVLRCLQLYRAYNINAIAIIDRDKESSYSGRDDIIFTKEEDFEEEVYSHFKFRNYLRYLIQIEQVNSIISKLKMECDSFNPKEFITDPLGYRIPFSVRQKFIIDNREIEIKRLRDNKNAINGSLLAQYVNEIPECFNKLINSVIGKVEGNE